MLCNKYTRHSRKCGALPLDPSIQPRPYRFPTHQVQVSQPFELTLNTVTTQARIPYLSLLAAPWSSELSYRVSNLTKPPLNTMTSLLRGRLAHLYTFWQCNRYSAVTVSSFLSFSLISPPFLQMQEKKKNNKQNPHSCFHLHITIHKCLPWL